jgi:hypothetical protein
MNQEKQHPTPEQRLQEKYDAQHLLRRKIAGCLVLSLPFVFGVIIRAGFNDPSLMPALMGGSTILILVGIATAAFATEGGESLPF